MTPGGLPSPLECAKSLPNGRATTEVAEGGGHSMGSGIEGTRQRVGHGLDGLRFDSTAKAVARSGGSQS